MLDGPLQFLGNTRNPLFLREAASVDISRSANFLPVRGSAVDPTGVTKRLLLDSPVFSLPLLSNYNKSNSAPALLFIMGKYNHRFHSKLLI
jgi:hypothetical protein